VSLKSPPLIVVLAGLGIGALLGFLLSLGSLGLLVVPPLEGTYFAALFVGVYAAPTVLMATGFGGVAGALIGYRRRNR